MNICMLVSNFLPRQGGAEYAVHHLTKALIELGHRVTVFAAYDANARGIEYPYPVTHSPRIPLLSSDRQRFLHAWFHLRHRKFDLIHAHIVLDAGFVGAKLKQALGLPLVITAHGGDVQVVAEIQYGLCLKPEKSGKVRFALGLADRVTAVSQRMQVAIAERGCDPNRIRPVPYGTEFQKIQRIHEDGLRGQLGLSSDDFVVLSVGRNSTVKDIPTLLEGFRKAAAAEPRLKCILVGPDDSIRGSLEQHGLSDRVKLLGRIPSGYDPERPDERVFQTPYRELIAAYRACDVFAATSYIESFNTAALDAFACGKPVLITNTQGFMDVLEEGVNGHSVPPRDPAAVAERLLHMAHNRELCQRMGEAARNTAAQFDWSLVAQRYLRVYEEAVPPPRSTG